MKNQLRSCRLLPFNGFLTAGILTIAPLAVPLGTIASQSPPPMTAQAETVPTTQPILNACVQNQAETLPNPFTDVPRQHWAFKAVLTLHYCGAYRQATPHHLIQPRTQESAPDQTPSAVP